MYSATDPRSTLDAGTPAGDPNAPIAELATFGFLTMPPQETTGRGGRTWYVRGQNMAIAYSRLPDGDTLRRTAAGQREEYMIIVPDDAVTVEITSSAGGRTESRTVSGRGVVIVPPGDSTVTARGEAELFRVFDTRTEDVTALCANAASYAEPHPRVAPLKPWPDPPAGHRLRVYLNADHPRVPGRFGRLFRSSSLMVNFGDPSDGPRDPNRMSPHHHDDFEQCSLTVAGDYVHHVRTPWTSRLDQWRDDEHARVSSPSATIIPPPTVHTSQAMGAGRHLLIDVFSPPRADFSAKPGWVLNADEYPAP
ncbi:cupin domain-containing protein [Sphaerisporangium aureirubrum]|uniref:5-deoxy-glucuronate isomerase n=1 Tax=Sphaerisporangium aureirubrum TaxID=1544736 RepID=A0ABW1NWS2_9ACTN